MRSSQTTRSLHRATSFSTRDKFINMSNRLLEPRDDLFLLGDQRVELRDLDGVVALLVLAKAKTDT